MRTQQKISYVYRLLVVVCIFFLLPIVAYAACPDNMISHWKLDETSGSTYQDNYSYNDGTGAADPTAATGQIDGAQYFDGTSDGITVAAPTSSNYTWASDASFSIELWVKLTTTGVAQTFIGRYESTGDGDDSDMSWYVGVNASDEAVFRLVDRSGVTGGNVKGGDLSDGEWHHIVAVRDGESNNSLLYVDETLVNTVSVTHSFGFSDASADITIGYSDNSAFARFNGTLDEIAIYNAALSADDIAEHYSNGIDGEALCSTFLPYPEDTIAVWALDEVSAGTYEDSFLGYDGTGAADPTAATGQIDGAQYFDGTSDGITVPAPTSSNYTWASDASFSIELWVKLTTTGVAQTFIGRYESTGDGDDSDMSWYVGVNASDEAVFRLVDRSGVTGGNVKGGDLSDGAWHHIVAVRDGESNNSLLYVDETLVNTVSVTHSFGFSDASADITIGYSDNSAFPRFNGTLDEIAIFGRALSATEVGDHYDAGILGDGINTLRPAPTADAGDDQEEAGSGSTEITLDGSGSAAGYSGTTITYAWTQTSGTSVTLSDATAQSPTFTAPLVTSAGTLAFSLTVTASDGQSATDTTNVALTVPIEPTADAGDAQSVTEGDTVTLDASGSSAAYSGELTYAWTAPTGVTLSSASAEKPTFTAPDVEAATEYDFEVTVTEAVTNLTDTDTVTITVNPEGAAAGPVADAGADQSVKRGATVTLDGSASTPSVDGATLTYAWTQTDDSGFEVELSSATTAQPTFTAPSEDATLTFQLVVTEEGVGSDMDTVTITVSGSGGGGGGSCFIDSMF